MQESNVLRRKVVVEDNMPYQQLETRIYSLLGAGARFA